MRFVISAICVLFALTLLFSCKKDEAKNCPSQDQIISQFIQPTGEEVIIDINGKGYVLTDGECEFVAEMFDPDFRNHIYLEENGMILIKTPEGNVRTLKTLSEDFESYDNFTDLFYSSIQEISSKHWSTMTLQSPSAKTVEAYVALKQCILEGSCDFIDNRIELVDDPINDDNQCLKFTSVAKTDDMVTCKSSIISELLFFEKGNDLWFSADFLIQDNQPFSLVDFENRHFENSPGPRLVISNNRLAIENKFGVKEFYRHDKNTLVPFDQWFNVKIHLSFNETDNGLLELWQDGQLLFSINGENLPYFNSIQNSIEIGATASSVASTVFVDNLRIDDQPF